MSFLPLCDLLYCARELFSHHHGEPGCPISSRSLTYGTEFPRPRVDPRASAFEPNIRLVRTGAPVVSKPNIPLRSSENAHPLSQITIWEAKVAELPNSETLDQNLFQVAQLFIGATKIQPETPELQFASSESKEERTLRICQLLALLLAHSTDSADVTAVTVHLDTISKPPIFQFVFCKNKEPASPYDVERAVKLAQVIRDNASKSCQAFVTSLCNYMATYCSHNQVRLGKYILKLTSPLITHLDRMIQSPGPKDWQHDFIDTNAGDKIIANLATKKSVTPLQGLLAMLTCLINVAKCCQKPSVDGPPAPPIKGKDLATLGKYAHILRESSLFLRFVDRIPAEESKALGMELWESFRTLEVFHTSSILLWEQVSDERYKNVVPHLTIIAANPIAEFDFGAIGKKYKLSLAKAVVGSPSGEMGPSLPIGDFWNFVQVRTKKTGRPLHGLRHDFLKSYPGLLIWDGNFTSNQTLHCEVKLALDCLHRRRKGKIVIGVSKQKCLCCEAWFDAVNAKAKNIAFILSPGHKKVYPGWRPSGIEDGDRKVIDKVWETVDDIIAEVKRVEAKDLVAAVPLQSQEIDLDVAEIDDLGSVINQMKSEGG